MTADQECRSQKALDAQVGLSSLAANKLDRKEKLETDARTRLSAFGQSKIVIRTMRLKFAQKLRTS